MRCDKDSKDSGVSFLQILLWLPSRMHLVSNQCNGLGYCSRTKVCAPVKSLWCCPHWWRLRRVRCRRISRLADNSLSMRICHRRSLHLMLPNAKSTFFFDKISPNSCNAVLFVKWLDWPRSVPLICAIDLPHIQATLAPTLCWTAPILDLLDTLLQGSASMLLASYWSPLERPREIIDCYPSPWSNNRLSSRSPRHFRSHFSSETAALVVIAPHLLPAF